MLSVLCCGIVDLRNRATPDVRLKTRSVIIHVPRAGYQACRIDTIPYHSTCRTCRYVIVYLTVFRAHAAISIRHASHVRICRFRRHEIAQHWQASPQWRVRVETNDASAAFGETMAFPLNRLTLALCGVLEYSR